MDGGRHCNRAAQARPLPGPLPIAAKRRELQLQSLPCFISLPPEPRCRTPLSPRGPDQAKPETRGAYLMAAAAAGKGKNSARLGSSHYL